MDTLLPSRRLLLLLSLGGDALLGQAADGDTQNHEDLDGEQADPDGVEDPLLVAVEVAVHCLYEHGVHVLEEEEGLEDIAGVPVLPFFFGQD